MNSALNRQLNQNSVEISVTYTKSKPPKQIIMSSDNYFHFHHLSMCASLIVAVELVNAADEN